VIPTAVAAAGDEPEPVVTYENFRTHYRERTAAVAGVLVTALAVPSRLADRLAPPQDEEGA
jgi:hypothetical protein